MDFQTIILDHVFSERTGMLLLLAVTLYYLLVQNKIQSEIESELKNVKEKVNQLVKARPHFSWKSSCKVRLSRRTLLVEGVRGRALLLSKHSYKPVSLTTD